MFWKFGGYGNISPVDAILDRPDFTLEELLEESELIGDLKAHNTKLLDYIRQPDVVDRLLDYVVAPKAEVAPEPPAENKEDEPAPVDDEAGRGRPRALAFTRSRASSSATDGNVDEEDEAEKKRTRYAYVSCEILSSDNWAICETIMDPSNRRRLHRFWEFLKRPAPLDPLQASYFTKVNESLFDRKVEEMVEFIKVADNTVQDMLRHVDCPMVMDLLLKIITLDRPEAYQGVVEWLYTQDLMPTLLSFLSPENSWATQTSAGDFIKAIITVSANATQHEQTCIGPNELTRQLVSHPCIDELIGYMLNGGNALTVGVGIVIEVIRKNNSDYDPDVGTEANIIPSSRDPIYLGTLLRMFAQNVPNFMHLMSNAPAQKTRLNSTFGGKIEPLGFDRFKTCELMAELLHCSNMGLLNEPGSEELIAIRDAQRKRLRAEGKLTPNRGEEASPSSADMLTMGLSHASPSDEGRRLEVTNATATDDDGFEEVTHSAVLGDEQQLPNQPQSSQSFMDKDEDDFVDEPLSSPRLKTHDDKVLADMDHQFDDPDLIVAPLSPAKKKSTPADESDESDARMEVPPLSLGHGAASQKEDLADNSDDFVTEATEPALGDEAKRMVPDLEKGDDSDSSILFTPTISTMADSLGRRTPSPPPGTASPAVAEEQATKAPATEELVAEESTGAETVNATADATADDAKKTGDEVPQVEVSEPQTDAAQAPLEAATEALSGLTVAAAQGDGAAQPETLAATESSADAETGTDFGDASIIVTHQPSESGAPADETAEMPASDPVVGDYLKMQFVDHRVVPTILSFFFSYPWNNFLHNVVYDVVQQVFNGPMDRGFNPHLAISLFESADITTQIVNGQAVSDQSQAATKMRMGYMGHLTLIAEEVVKFTERHPAELLSETVVAKILSPDWTNYIDGTLTETRERDNATLGGVRPEASMNNHAAASGLAAVGLGSSLGLSGSGGSNALAEAGLNGGLEQQGSHDGPFSISAGISSGFHSSSDEEDDDGDDNDEDVNNEFRAYTDPLNSSNSLLPPAIPPPPPPPPLNIPPSRARQLLAARLAMNKRNAESAAELAGGKDETERLVTGDGADGDVGSASLLTGSGLSSTLQESSSQPLRNPFADDEDDDIDDGDDDDDNDDDDDDDDDDVGLGSSDVGRVGLGWNRGGWWRSMVRRDRNKNSSSSIGGGGTTTTTTDDAGTFGQEKFGDGRDSSDGSSSGDEGLGRSETKQQQQKQQQSSVPGLDDVEDEDDEEFGDFAMPESGGSHGGADETGSGSGNAKRSSGGLLFDRDRETILFKPLALHPTPPSSSSTGLSGTTATAGGSLWRLGFLGAGSTSPPAGTSTFGGFGEATGESSSSSAKSQPRNDDELEVLGEDGHRVACVTEAKRRTSLEDPDEDEVVL